MSTRHARIDTALGEVLSFVIDVGPESLDDSLRHTIPNHDKNRHDQAKPVVDQGALGDVERRRSVG